MTPTAQSSHEEQEKPSEEVKPVPGQVKIEDIANAYMKGDLEISGINEQTAVNIYNVLNPGAKIDLNTKIDSKEMEQAMAVAKEIHKQLMEPGFFRSLILKVVDTVDNLFGDFMRRNWEKLSPEVKNAAITYGLYEPETIPDVFGMSVRALMQSGFIEISEEEHKKALEWQKTAMTGAVSAAAVFGNIAGPEANLLFAAIAPLREVLQMKDDFFKGIRAHMKLKRIAQSTGTTKEEGLKPQALPQGKSLEAKPPKMQTPESVIEQRRAARAAKRKKFLEERNVEQN